MSWSLTIVNHTTEPFALMLWYFEKGDWPENQTPAPAIEPTASATFTWETVSSEIVGRIVYAGDTGSIDIDWALSPAADTSSEPAGYSYISYPSGDGAYAALVTQSPNNGSIIYDLSPSRAWPVPQVLSVAPGPPVASSASAPMGVQPAMATNSAVMCKPLLCPPYSGEWWCRQFPEGKTTETLTEPFRTYVESFRDALAAATVTTDAVAEPTTTSKGAKKKRKNKAPRVYCSINQSLRMIQQSYLMHFATRVTKTAYPKLISAKLTAVPPTNVPAYSPAKAKAGDPHRLNPSVLGIRWDHDGDDTASTEAARQMWSAFNIRANPVGYPSNHNMGNAVDISVWWEGHLTVRVGEYPNPKAPAPHPSDAGTLKTISSTSGTQENAELVEIARSYGLIHLWGDRPHYSIDGH